MLYGVFDVQYDIYYSKWWLDLHI